MNAAPDVPGPDAVRRVGERVRELSLETQHYVDDVARHLGLHRSDVAAIGVLLAAARGREVLTQGALAKRLHLSAAAVSAVLDRLQRTGHARRAPHAVDRRMVCVDASRQAHATSQTMFARLTHEQEYSLAAYSPQELALAERVLADLTRATQRARELGPGDAA